MNIRKKPHWLQKKINYSEKKELDNYFKKNSIHTICKEAMCPNLSECFSRKQASFLILGAVCTRMCSFCNVSKGVPLFADPEESKRVAEAVKRLALKHVVITSPTRDDLEDGGAAQFYDTVLKIRDLCPGCAVEVLIPDFQGNSFALERILAAEPEIIGHNLETVKRLYEIRKGADYSRSLDVIRYLRNNRKTSRIKSGIMVGLGETEDEVMELFRELFESGCEYLSIGQYLAPSKKHFPVVDYICPEQFEQYRHSAVKIGFQHVESGPYVRSSYHAGDYLSP